MASTRSALLPVDYSGGEGGRERREKSIRKKDVRRAAVPLYIRKGEIDGDRPCCCAHAELCSFFGARCEGEFFSTEIGPLLLAG